MLNEANAIGTTAPRARLLPEPYRTDSLNLLREYVKVRLDITARPPSRTELKVAIERSDALQEALWQQAKAMAVKDNGLVPTGLFIQALNETVGNQGKRLAALRNRVPNIVLLSLFGRAAIAGAFVGYASGLEPRRTRPPVYIFGFLVTIVIFLMVDLDRPSGGFIKVSQQPTIDTAASIASFLDQLVGSAPRSRRCSLAVLRHPRVERFLSDEHFSVDGTLVEAWASIKSLRAKDGSDEPPSPGATASVLSTTRTATTNAPATDVDRKLYRKGNRQTAKLCYMGTCPDRHGFIVGATRTATGMAEREAAI